MIKSPITFILLAYNEEHRLRYAVESLIEFGPVLVLDGGSTDRTESIARELGAMFLRRPPSTRAASETQENFDFALTHTKTDWIYWGYVDNIAPRSLVQKLCEIARDNHYKKVHIPLFTYLWGNTKHYAQKSHIPALFHKDYIDFTNNHIHSMGTFTGGAKEILILPSVEKYALRHFSTYNESKYVAGYMRYAEEEAAQKYGRGERFSVIKLLAAMARYMWIYRRAFKSPRLGLLVALNMAFGRLMTYTRLYELEHGITLESIEDAYARKKEEVLKEK